MSGGASSSGSSNSTTNNTSGGFAIPDLPNSQAYITEIHKIFDELATNEPSGEMLPRTIFTLIGMAQAAKQKMELEKKDKAEIDSIMEAIGSLQIKAFEKK